MKRFLGLGGLALLCSCLGESMVPETPMAPPEPAVELAEAEVIARRLARLLWDERGEDVWRGLVGEDLSTPRAVGALAERMLGDPRARRGVGAFFGWWLWLKNLPSRERVGAEGILDPELLRSMTGEAPALGAFLTLERPGTFRELLTGSTTFVDGPLARYYGIDGITGPSFHQVPYQAGQNRVGILSGAGVLTRSSSVSSPSWPAKRGWLISEQLLCVRLPPRPMPATRPDGNRSIRQQTVEVTGRGTTCHGCHKHVDEPGFAFIGFDAFGRWRPETGHAPDENRGSITGDVLPGEPRFEDLAGLAHLLASRPEASRCFVQQWLEFAITPDDRPTPLQQDALAAFVEQIHADLQRAGGRLRAVPVAVARSAPFLQKGPIPSDHPPPTAR